MQLFFYWQDDCAPCDAKKPEAQAVAREAGLELKLLNIAAFKECVDAHKVRSTPTLVLVDGAGNRLAGWSGNMIKRSSVLAAVKRLTQQEDDEV